MVGETEQRRPLRDSEKEGIKLTATYLNGIAIGILLVGGITIPSSIVLNASDDAARVLAGAISLFNIGLSPYIHLQAKRWLRRLDG